MNSQIEIYRANVTCKITEIGGTREDFRVLSFPFFFHFDPKFDN